MGKNQKYIPGQVVWETTLRCNLKCIHCGSSAGKSRQNELTTKEALKVVKDLSELNTESVCLMGGEPFLRKDWDIISKEIKNYNMKLLFISNGYNINDKIIFSIII